MAFKKNTKKRHLPYKDIQDEEVDTQIHVDPSCTSFHYHHHMDMAAEHTHKPNYLLYLIGFS